MCASSVLPSRCSMLLLYHDGQFKVAIKSAFQLLSQAKLRKFALHFILILRRYCSVDLTPSLWCFPNTVQAYPELASKPLHCSDPETIYDIPVLVLDEFQCDILLLGRPGLSLSTNVGYLMIIRGVPFVSIPEFYKRVIFTFGSGKQTKLYHRVLRLGQLGQWRMYRNSCCWVDRPDRLSQQRVRLS